MLMSLRSKFFKSAYNVVVPPSNVSFASVDVTPLIDQDEVQTLCPINELGVVGDVLSRALSSDTSPQLRSNLLDMLHSNVAVDDSRFASLPDEVRLNLVKLRNCQTLTEVHAYADALSSWFDNNNIEPSKPTDPTEPIDPTEPTVPSSPSDNG